MEARQGRDQAAPRRLGSRQPSAKTHQLFFLTRQKLIQCPYLIILELSKRQLTQNLVAMNLITDPMASVDLCYTGDQHLGQSG